MIKSLGLEYQKINMCPNFCMLYYLENAELIECRTCGNSCYKLWRFNRMKNTESLLKWILSLLQKTLGPRKSNSRTYLEFKLVLMTENRNRNWTWIGWEQIHPNFSLYTHNAYCSSLPIPFGCCALYACRLLVRNSRIYSFLTRVYWHITNYKWNGAFGEFEDFPLRLCSNSFPCFVYDSSLRELMLAACNKSSPIKPTLSSRWNSGKRAAISSTFSHVASAGESPFQWIKTWVIAWFLLRAILLSIIACGCNSCIWGIGGRSLCTGWRPILCLSWETWNTGWIADDGGNSSLYATSPILAITR